MKTVTFKQLKIRNFLSVGDDPIIIDFRKGIHIITGINRDKEDRRNGVGKSTVADAIYFAIFGSTVRELKKELIINNITGGTCVVELSFNVNSPKGNDNFNIVRSLNPSKLTITKNNLDKTRDSIANTTEYISAVLSSSPEIFQNCVIMTVNNTLPFMAKSKAEKRKFIEQIFNLQVFSQMMTLLREDANNVSKTFDVESTKFDEIQKTVDTYTKQKEAKERDKKHKIQTNQTAIDNAQIAINGLVDDINKIVVVDIDEKQKKLDTLKKACTVLEDSMSELVKQEAVTKSIISQKHANVNSIGTSQSKCPVCLRLIEDHDREMIEREKQAIRSEIETLNNQITTFNDDISKIKAKISKIKNLINDMYGEIMSANNSQNKRKLQLQKLAGQKGLIEQIQKTIDQILSENDGMEDAITETLSRKQSVQQNIEKLKAQIGLLDVVKFVVSEEGVKSYIVKKILQNFNSKLAYYLKKLDSNCICVFNEYFDEEIVNEKGKICSYNNFSGAEKKAIDLACLFAFMDVRKSQGDVHYNISIYDELFDSSFDERGVEIALDILKDRCDKLDECIFIISHRRESIKFATGDVIYLEKHNDITRRVMWTN